MVRGLLYCNSHLLPKADIPVETLILCVILQKNQLNLMGLIYAMHSNGPLPQVKQSKGKVAETSENLSQLSPKAC